MKETIDETIKRWLRKWLGIDDPEFRRAVQADFNNLVALDKRLTAGLAEIENTRADLIQRMEDLGVELAERKQADKPESKGELEQVSPGRVPFSQRRRQAQGSGSNPSAYIVPRKKV